MLKSLNYSFRNPKNIIWVIYRIKQLRNYKKKNHGGGKQCWRATLGISRVKQLTVPQLVKNSSHFTEPKISSPCSQQHASHPYPEPRESSTSTSIVPLRFNFILCSHLRFDLPSGLSLSFRVPHQNTASLLRPYVPHALPISSALIWSP